MSPARSGNSSSPSLHGALRAAAFSFSIAALFAPTLHAQAITIDKNGNIKNGNGPVISTVDRRFAQIEPTHIALSNTTLDAKTRLELVRFLEAEQGFAMRPLPRGHKGLTLVANGKVEPAGEAWLDAVTENGLSAKPGDRVVLTDVKIERNRIIFQLNGGPDPKHRFLRHIEIGGGMGGDMNPVVQDDGSQPVGSRITLTFDKPIPELTGTQVEALLAPLISFGVKSPVEAFTDTLPPVLKNAILNHHVMVGMSTDMVLYAIGRPRAKSREMDGQMPFEVWIYGTPPKPVEFVRINGNRVIRLEIAKVGEPPEVFTKDEVSGLMRTDGTPAIPSGTRTVNMGDTTYNPDTQAAPAPPSLRKPGEKLPDQSGNARDREGEMGPVEFPKPNPADNPPVAHQPQTQPQTQTQPSTQQPSPTNQPAQPQPQ